MIHEVGKVVWMEGFIFYCPQCDMRFDYAILYEDESEIIRVGDELTNSKGVYRCRLCSTITILKEASFRFGLRSPHHMKALNELIIKKLKGFGKEKDWL